MVKIEVDQEACVGSGICVMTAPELFSQDDEDGRVQLIADLADGDLAKNALEAERLCPAAAVVVHDGPL